MRILIHMDLTFDPAKDAWNIANRGLSFMLAADMDWDCALTRVDSRRDYNETRLVSLVPLDGRLFVVVHVTQGEAMRCESSAFARQTTGRSISMSVKHKLIRNTPEEEAEIQRGIAADPDSYALTDAKMSEMVPYPEFMKRQRGRPKLDKPKERVTLYIDYEVVSAFRSSGDGWQTKMNGVLVDWLKTHSIGKV